MTHRVFVTGGTGLVGSHLLYELATQGYRIKALKRPSSDINRVQKVFSYYTEEHETLFAKIEWIEAELFDYQAITEAVEGCAQVYHAAATVSFNRKDKTGMMHTNVNGTANIVNVCTEKQIPLCHVSSIGALGRSGPGKPVTEKDFWQSSEGRSAYSYSKYQSEMEVWRGMAEGLNAVIVNPAVILGPGDWNRGSSLFFSRVHKGMRFYTAGTTAFVDVRDVVRCMMMLAEQKYYGNRYILSAGEMSYHELFDSIADGLQVKKPTLEARPWMLKTGYYLSAAFTSLTGKKPVLTRETLRSATQKLCYSNEKVRETLHYEFIPLPASIQDCCWFFQQFSRN